MALRVYIGLHISHTGILAKSVVSFKGSSPEGCPINAASFFFVLGLSFPLQFSLNSDIMREIDLDMRRKSVQCKTEELS